MKKIIVFLAFAAFSLELSSEIFKFKYDPSEKYELSIRGNYKIYLNDKYKGLNSKEIKGVLEINNNRTNDFQISGKVYHFKKTFRDYQDIGNLIDNFEDCAFNLSSDGTIVSSSNPVFPPLSRVPFFPDEKVEVNAVYKNNASVNINVFGIENPVKAEVISTTKYFGKKEYRGILFDYFEISYRYEKVRNNPEIKNIRGQHNLSLYFNNESGKPVFMKDTFIEEIELSNSDKVRQDGFFLYFYKLIIPMDKEKIETALKIDINEKENKDFTVSKKETGVAITINNLKFKPDSKELLSEDKNKLIPLAEALKKISGRSFMIIGHTALFGTKEEQDKLSLERAKTIAEFLIKNNISPEKIFYSGKGSREPAAPNDTEENMQKNRRVEIIILED